MKVKVSLIGLADMLKFKHLKDNRLKAIDETQIKPIQRHKINDLADYYHPKKQYLVLDKIVDENETTKSFLFKPDESMGTKKLAYFKSGSYVSLYVKIGDSIASRAYAISSSPKEALEGIYRITIKRKEGGFVSEYMLDQAKVGDKMYCTEPGGFLTYDRLRDAKHVVAIAGGTGITPFVSIANAIKDGIEDFDLTILYGVNKFSDRIFGEELDEIMKATDKVKVVYVTADKRSKGDEYGYVTAEIIKKYAPKKEPYSVFVSGPNGLFSFLETQLPELKLEQKYIRLEKSPMTLTPEDPEKEYEITVHIEGEAKTIKAKANETILNALERSDIAIRAKCHLGGCGYCRSRLLKGTVACTKLNKQSDLDKKLGYIHPCCTYPTSDLEIEVYKY